MTDFEGSELFNFLNTKRKDALDDDSDNEIRAPSRKLDRFEDKENKMEERMDIMILENHFEKWFREEDSLQAFLNPKVAK
jgi:hypothetical protein